MIANISPCSSSVEHTLNTLRYADRVKGVARRGLRALPLLSSVRACLALPSPHARCSTC